MDILNEEDARLAEVVADTAGRDIRYPFALFSTNSGYNHLVRIV
jgi:hypothetical protein